MRHPLRQSFYAWGLTLLLFGVGSGLLALAWREGIAESLVSTSEVRPDGQQQSIHLATGGGRYEHHIFLVGTFQGRFNGVTYDALNATSPEQPAHPHNLLELSGGTSAPILRSEPGEHRYEIAPAESGVTIRLFPEPVTDDMRLPEEEQRRAYEGALRLEVWARDRWRQRVVVAGLALPGVCLLLAGGMRLRRQRPGHTPGKLPLRNQEIAALWRQIRRARKKALEALKYNPVPETLLQPRVEALYECAGAVCQLAEACARTRQASQPGSLAEQTAAAEYQKQQSRLLEIEAALATLPLRLAEAQLHPAEQMGLFQSELAERLHLVAANPTLGERPSSLISA